MFKPEVIHNEYSGEVVVRLNKSGEHYIEGRRRYHGPMIEYVFIEAVRDGQVYHRQTVHESLAPEAIMTMVRKHAQGVSINA